MAQSDGGIGNVTPNAELVLMAMSYSRSFMLSAAARLGIADALGEEERSADYLAKGMFIYSLFALVRATTQCRPIVYAAGPLRIRSVAGAAQ